VLGNTACATILRGSKADLTFRNPPHDLQAFDEQGRPLALQNTSDGNLGTQIDYEAQSVTLASGDTRTKVELDSRVSLGYLIVDLLLYVIPAAIDWGTGKWNNFEDVDARVALAKASGRPPPNQPARRAEQEPLIAEARGTTPAGQTALVAPASTQQSLIEPAASPPEHRTPIVTSSKLAVLDFHSYTDALKPEDVRYFTDVVRGATLKASPSLQVMTRENLLVLLQATGKDAANCEGECEVDTGRRIGADVVVSGEILKVGSHFKLSLKLHETREGRLLSTAVASGKSIDDLDDSAQAAAIELIAPLR